MTDTTTLGIAAAAIVIGLLVLVWAWSRRQKKRFDDAANIPFKDEDEHRGDDNRG